LYLFYIHYYVLIGPVRELSAPKQMYVGDGAPLVVCPVMCLTPEDLPAHNEAAIRAAVQAAVQATVGPAIQAAIAPMQTAINDMQIAINDMQTELSCVKTNIASMQTAIAVIQATTVPILASLRIGQADSFNSRIRNFNTRVNSVLGGRYRPILKVFRVVHITIVSGLLTVSLRS